VVSLAATSFAPHHLCTYLYALAQAFNSFYTATQIVEVGTDGLLTPTSHFRVVLTATVGMVLKNGLQSIGIETVRQM
ncbi:arginine--tRNA ligase, partial [Candidatus Woesebacteria bacterium]|nr:arginine--tRNA ligase [Candidatus Woesebacteria bacterium]